jgi:hypothetical protein
MGADPAIINDLPNESGIPNHTDGMPGCTGNACPDNHDVLTGTGPKGTLYSMNNYNTCNDWTSAEGQPTAPAAAPAGVERAVAVARLDRRAHWRRRLSASKGPWCGHSWPRQGSGENWMSALAEAAAPRRQSHRDGRPATGRLHGGTGGGYGAIYCFALEP